MGYIFKKEFICHIIFENYILLKNICNINSLTHSIYYIQTLHLLYYRCYLLRNLLSSVIQSDLFHYTRQCNSVTGIAVRSTCPDTAATLSSFNPFRILFSRSQNNLCRGKTMDLSEPQQISVPSPCPFTLVYFYPRLRLSLRILLFFYREQYLNQRRFFAGRNESSTARALPPRISTVHSRSGSHRENGKTKLYLCLSREREKEIYRHDSKS